MWRRNELAVISNSSASSRRYHDRRLDDAHEDLVLGLGRREGAEVVLAAQEIRRLGQALLVQSMGIPPGAVGLERRAGLAAVDAVAVAPRERGVARVEVGGRRLGREHDDVGRQLGVQRLPRPLDRRPALDLDGGHVLERVDARIGPSGDGEVRTSSGTPSRAPLSAPPRPCAAPAGRPSRGRPCRRTRALASGARQEPLAAFVRCALCSTSLRLD